MHGFLRSERKMKKHWAKEVTGELDYRAELDRNGASAYECFIEGEKRVLVAEEAIASWAILSGPGAHLRQHA